MASPVGVVLSINGTGVVMCKTIQFLMSVDNSYRDVITAIWEFVVRTTENIVATSFHVVVHFGDRGRFHPRDHLEIMNVLFP